MIPYHLSYMLILRHNTLKHFELSAWHLNLKNVAFLLMSIEIIKFDHFCEMVCIAITLHKLLHVIFAKLVMHHFVWISICIILKIGFSWYWSARLKTNDKDCYFLVGFTGNYHTTLNCCRFAWIVGIWACLLNWNDWNDWWERWLIRECEDIRLLAVVNAFLRVRPPLPQGRTWFITLS